jgi:hypothetical protein
MERQGEFSEDADGIVALMPQQIINKQISFLWILIGQLK